MSNRVPYPPCITQYCDSRLCCHPGAHKNEWPELVGQDGKQAKLVIEADNPFVTVIVLPFGKVGLTDFCCNRVYIFLDEGNKVWMIPKVG